MMLLDNAQKSAGGMAQITGPVQGNSMVQGAWTGYAGNFNKPSVIPGVQNFQFNTCYYLVPVPLVMGESLLQSTEAVIPILDIRMNDVQAVMAQQMAQLLFTNNSNNTLQPSSFIDAYDNGSNIPTYGGINRTIVQNGVSNAFWQGQYYNAAGANILNRASLSSLLIQVSTNAGGEAPDFVVMSPSDFAALSSSFIGVENVYLRPNETNSMDATVRSGFPNLDINGVPFFMDHWCPKGTMIMVNSKYFGMYLSEDAPFLFSGFYSTIPLMQVAQVGVTIVGYQIVCSKPSSGAIITNFTGGAF